MQLGKFSDSRWCSRSDDSCVSGDGGLSFASDEKMNGSDKAGPIDLLYLKNVLLKFIVAAAQGHVEQVNETLLSSAMPPLFVSWKLAASRPAAATLHHTKTCSPIKRRSRGDARKSLHCLLRRDCRNIDRK